MGKINLFILVAMVFLVGIISAFNFDTGTVSSTVTINLSGVNGSFSQSLADTLYAPIKWNYNQTTATYDIYGKWWYNHTFDVETLYGKWFYNQSTVSTTYYPNVTWTIGGTNTTNNLTLLWYYDGDSYNVTEGNGANPLDMYINFTSISSFSQIVMREYYDGGTSHNIQVSLWDYDSSSWESYYTFVGQGGFTILTIPVFDPSKHISSNIVQFRFHHVENGVASHRLYVDFVWLVDGNNIGASTNLAGYAKYNFSNNNFVGTGNFSTTGKVNATLYCNITNCYGFDYLLNESIFKDWNSTFLYNYNQTYSGSTYNATYDATTTAWNGNYTAYAKYWYNQTSSTYNATYDTHINNLTLHNQTLVYNHTLSIETLYNKWFYNMTLGAIDDINARFWNRTQSYNSTEIDIKIINNNTYFATYNSTYASYSYNQSLYCNTTGACSAAAYMDYNNAGNLNITKNLTVGGSKICLETTCAKYIYYNGSSIIING